MTASLKWNKNLINKQRQEQNGSANNAIFIFLDTHAVKSKNVSYIGKMRVCAIPGSLIAAHCDLNSLIVPPAISFFVITFFYALSFIYFLFRNYLNSLLLLLKAQPLEKYCILLCAWRPLERQLENFRCRFEN